MRKLVLIVVFLATQAANAELTHITEGWVTVEKSEYPIIQQAFIEESNLIDPFSAQFRNVYAKEVKGTIDGVSVTNYCGEINSKNRMGGYVGWSFFYINVISDNGINAIGVLGSQSGYDPSEIMYDLFCASLN